jgi:hypothetical protein
MAAVNRGDLDRAKRRALNILDEWLDVTGVIPPGSSYRDELEGVVEDAVECGAQAALGVREPLDSEKS